MSELIVKTENGVRTLKLNRPERLNALHDALSSQLIHELEAASVDDSVRVLVITGEGRGFCTGLDLTSVPAMLQSTSTRSDRLDELGWVGRLAMSIVHCDKPVIAAINGIAAGAGLALALACDFRFMASSASVTTGYIRRGLNPDAGMTYFLPKLVGYSQAVDLILTGRTVEAMQAEKIGLVNQVFPDAEFQTAVANFAVELASGPPIAVTLSKRLLVQSFETDLVSQLKQELSSIRYCFGTQDVQEGVAAFQEKRKPEFKGR